LAILINFYHVILFLLFGIFALNDNNGLAANLYILCASCQLSAACCSLTPL